MSYILIALLLLGIGSCSFGINSVWDKEGIALPYFLKYIPIYLAIIGITCLLYAANQPTNTVSKSKSVVQKQDRTVRTLKTTVRTPKATVRTAI